MSKTGRFFKPLDLSSHIDYRGANDNIRKNIAFKGPNAVILACAIVIASVGLNVNSIPVIIGAMLISPVMGPILGFGFGLATLDGGLVKESLKNFAVMVGISIAFSALYFILSPLRLENPSELLARTNPTIYDVLIALFGGFAGILETSRREKGTVISGVAIATALMPPLCTVGYGISMLKFSYIAGALYLFLINSIFIALATFIGVKYLGFRAAPVSEQTRPMSRKVLAAVLVVILVPSIISAVNIVKENNFKIHADKVVSANRTLGKSFIYNHKTTYTSKEHMLELFMAGEALNSADREKIYRDAEAVGIMRSQIVIHDDATSPRETLSESEIVRGIYEQNDRQVRTLNETISRLEAELAAYKAGEIPAEAISKEIFAQYPNVTGIVLTDGLEIEKDAAGAAGQTVAILTSDEPLSQEELGRIERWLKIRMGKDNILIINK